MLDRSLRLLAVFAAGLAVGCGSSATTAPIHAGNRPAVAKTSVMAAELTAVDDAPRVGKPQHSRDEIVDEETAKDVPHRRVSRRGAGFSGYK